MAKVFVDTNIFVSSSVREMFDRARGADLATNIIVFYEFVDALMTLMSMVDRVRREGYREKILEFPSLLREVEVSMEPIELSHEDLEEALTIMKERQLDVGDALIYVSMKRRGINKIMTDDKDWERLKDLKVEVV